MTKIKLSLSKYGLLITLTIIVIGGMLWAYSGFKELQTLLETYHTPVMINIPTALPMTTTPQPTQKLLVITGLQTATPSPSVISPRVPDELTTFFGEHLYPVFIEDEGWRLTGLSGKLYYYWKQKASTWYAYPEVKDRYCSFPVVSYVEDEQLDSVCYLNFSGLGLISDEDNPSEVIITQGSSGNIHLVKNTSDLYALSFDSLHGYQWVETSHGYLNRISAAAKLIAGINPQDHIDEITIPNFIWTETYSTDISITARYVGSVDHQIVGKDGENLGYIKLHLFARNQDALFWVSGEGRVLGIRIGFPYSSWDSRKGKDVISYLEDSTGIFKENYRYEFFFFASSYVDIVPDTDAIDLSQFDEMTLIDKKMVPPEPWMTKQLLFMLQTYNQTSDWIDTNGRESDTFPTKLMPYYYIKTP